MNKILNYYTSGYISDIDNEERKRQGLDQQIDPLQNILGRCNKNYKNFTYTRGGESVIGDEPIPELPTSQNGWKPMDIKSTKYVSWEAARGWNNGYGGGVKEDFKASSSDVDLGEARPLPSGAACLKEVHGVEQPAVVSYRDKPDTNARSFGPKLWYILHNAAKAYPDSPTELVRYRMKNLILGIPYLVPCENCYEHSLVYIDNIENLDEICSSRKNLIKFFVEFHNSVNKRLGKNIYFLTE